MDLTLCTWPAALPSSCDYLVGSFCVSWNHDASDGTPVERYNRVVCGSHLTAALDTALYYSSDVTVERAS